MEIIGDESAKNNNYKTLITEKILFKNNIYNKNNNAFINIDKINQTTIDTFNDNDNEENLINTDSTLDTAKITKYIYKKKLTLSKNKINFYKPKKCFLKNFPSMKKNQKNNIKNFSLDKPINNNLSRMLKTSNNFYKKKNNLEFQNKMFNTSDNFYKKNKKENKENVNIGNSINIDDLIKFDEKINNLINSINNKICINISNECLELINYFYNSSLYDELEILFKNHQCQLIIHKSIIFIIFNAILAYYISYDKSFLNTCIDYLAIIININHKSYLLLCENISNKLNISNEKLNLILKNNSYHIELTDKDFTKYLTARKYTISKDKINFIHEIKYYSFLIQKYVKVLLKNLTNDIDKENDNNSINDQKEELLKIFNNIKSISFKEINDLFHQKIKYNIEYNTNTSKISNNLLKYVPINPNIKPPYIKTKLTKKFSLVLDLDETLISLDRYKSNDSGKGILKFRPGLLKFLKKIKKFYEVVVFTSGTKEYADQIIDVIESEEKFFDFRLCRDHTLYYNNEFIKDLSRIGRPLDKIIIVDNLPQNFRLQKENGIEIKPFFGDDNNDNALEHLGNILKKIVNRFNDSRNGILEYKSDIKNKVS